ncbi:glycosyltransferase [Selenomonas ruminantium]|uniref:Glycosyltransferase involved in cell wall bisynthesis n=1 Tax=Selenomonas ruminantium TaxID=971 RepID=A0A1H0RHL7_SELRU|nr:glycosyltransferase [Selenomonas ruminantium]SDP29037.1 Glycosyltransferase involved in cell wall bisynthesis [Selenomonas ruminantium]
MEERNVKISVCYIVRNEEQTLPLSLKSVQQAADEIVVVDTGSTDRTKKVALEFGAQIYDYVWQDDFAAARNFALDKLNSDWVIFLDADECFSRKKAKILRSLIADQAPSVNLILVQRQDVDEEGKVMLSLYVPRIFRLRKDLRYVGAIHEELRQNGGMVKGIVTVSPEQLRLIHTGYAGSLGKAKAQRNLDILRKELAKASDPGHLYGYLAEAYDGIDDQENAMKYAYLDIARGRQAETYASRSYRLLLGKLSRQKWDYQERQRVAKLAVQDFPEVPEFHAEYGESLAAGWQYRQAAGEMKRACELGQDYAGLEPSLFTAEVMKTCQRREDLFTKLAAKAERLNITACVIAKNEAKNIVRWLENAKVYANQCLLLDTGSTDNTCELAAGAEIYHYEWKDDFAAARNEALQYVKGDWVAFLDADEFFAHPEQVRGVLAECEIQHPDVEAVRLTICNVDEDDGGREISRFCNVRLFRNQPELRYAGRVHENLLNVRGNALEVWEEPCVEVIHTGYSSSVLLAKTQRNLALLKQDIAAKGEQPQHYRYLADCYHGLGDYQQAQLYALRAIDAPLKGQGTHGDMYYMVLLCMRALSEPEADQLAFAQAAARKFPALPDFPAVMGILYQENGQYEQGEKYLTRALRLARQSDGRESSSFSDIEALVYAKLADCEQHLGKSQAALQHSSQAMECSPYEEEVLTGFCMVRQENREKLIIEMERYFADTEQNCAFLCRFCERNGFGDLYEYYGNHWQERYGKELPRRQYYELLRQGDWQSLVDKLQQGLVANFELSIDLLLRLDRQQGKNFRDVERQLVALLPAEVQAIWAKISQGEAPADWQNYKIIWSHILTYGDDEQLEKYGELALRQQEIWQDIVKDLMEQEKWRAAFNLLAKVPQEEADGEFWQNLGRCLYHLGEYEAAREALERARQQGLDTMLMKSYEKWLENVSLSRRNTL